VDEDGYTALHLAAEHLNLFSVDLLITAGANINVSSRNGWTPLHMASNGWSISGLNGELYEFCNEDVVKLLIARGADQQAKTDKGETYKEVRRKCNYDVERAAVRSRRADWDKYNKPALIRSIVQGSPREDVITIIGPFHDVKQRLIFYENRVLNATIWRLWLNEVCHRLYFESPPPQTLVLNIAGVDQSHSIAIQDDNMIEGGRLIKYERNGKQVKLPTFSIDPKQTYVRFFESGYNMTQYDQRVYLQRFDHKLSRYINWELNLQHLSADLRKDFIVHVIYYKPDGNELMRQTKHSYAKEGWESSRHSLGWGWDEPGNWVPGNYHAVFSVAGKKVAEGDFEIY